MVIEKPKKYMLYFLRDNSNNLLQPYAWNVML